MLNPRAHVQHYTPEPNVTPTRRGLIYRVRRFGRIAWLTFQIWELETYVQQCERDGLLGGDSLLGFRLHLQQLRVRLAIAEAS